jgi:PBSX family phage portal protein
VLKLVQPTRKLGLPANKGKGRAHVLTNKLNDYSTPFMGLVRSTTEKAQIQDPFDGFYTTHDGDFSVIAPPLPFEQLVAVGRGNSALNQCIDAYVVNIESYGYQLEYIGPDGKEKNVASQSQKQIAISFLDHPNGERTLREVREETRKDLEYIGNRFFEISRDLSGRIAWFDSLPGTTMRRTRKDKDATSYRMAMRGPDGKLTEKEWKKNFCRFVQISNTGKRVFFKEFGDPRPVDPTTGLVNSKLAIEDQATEVYHHALYAVGSTYGQPRWLGALPSMLGLRESELVNLNFFRENAIPAMAVLISGGALTDESFEKVTTLFNKGRGKEAMNKVLILEAAADDSVGNADQAPPVPRIDMKPMNDARQSDGLFQEYGTEARKKIQSAMRLPAIYTGQSEDYTKATAQAGQRIAETQVFFPERSFFDEFINHRVLPTLGVSLWRFKTMGPSVYDPDSLGTLLDRFGRHGAMTPNILIKIANQVLDVQIPNITDKWGDIPFNYTLAMVAAGSQIEGFEDVFSLINDAATPAAFGNDTPPASGAGAAPSGAKNSPNAGAKKQLANQLASISNDIINKVNDALGTQIEAD